MTLSVNAYRHTYPHFSSETLLEAVKNGDKNSLAQIDHSLLTSYIFQKGETLLHLAIAYEQTDLVTFLIGIESDVNAEDHNRQTPLHYAALKGKSDIVSMLLKAEANPNARNNRNETPLHLASKHGRVEIIALLFEAGGDLEAQADDLTDRAGKKISPILYSPLHVAAFFDQPGAIKTLIDLGANTESLDANRHTPLLAAVFKGSLNAFNALLDMGALTTAKTPNSNNSLLHVAAKRGQVDIIHAVKKRVPNLITSTNLKGQTALHLAVIANEKKGIEALLELLEKTTPEEEWTPLHLAARHNRLEILETLIRCGANIEAKDVAGRSPLHVAILAGHYAVVDLLINQGASPRAQALGELTPLHLAVNAKKFSLVKLFIIKKADVTISDEKGKTPLHLAALLQDPRFAHALIEAGADVTAMDENGNTPLHYAAFQGGSETTSMLLKAEAKPNARNNRRETPLHLASRHGCIEIISLLFEAGGDLEAQADDLTDRRGRELSPILYSPLHVAAFFDQPDAVKTLINLGANTESLDATGQTPLFAAIPKESLRAFNILLDMGALTTAKTPNSLNSLLHVAAQWGRVNIIRAIKKRAPDLITSTNFKGRTALHFAAIANETKSVRALLELLEETTPKEQWTPLHLAARYNKLQILEVLIQCGANVKAKDENGNAPLHLAASRKHLVVATALLSCDTIDREAKNNDGKTPLCMAAAAGGLEMFSLLRSNGASVEAEHLPHAACEGGNLDIIEAIFDKDRFQKPDLAGRTPLMIALLHHSSQVVRFLDVHGIRPSFSEEDLDPSTARGRENIKLWDRWRDFEEAKCWKIDPSHLSWEIPIPAKPDSGFLLTAWENTLKTIESDKPSSVSLTDEEHPWYGLNRIVTYTAKRMHEGIASIPSDPVEKKRFFDPIERFLYYIFTAKHTKDTLSIYCGQLDDSGRACGESWLHNIRQVYIQAAQDLGDLPDPLSKRAIDKLFSDQAVQTALVKEAITLLLAAHDLQQRAFQREVIRYAGSRDPSDAHTIGLCARAFGDLFPLLGYKKPLTEDILTKQEVLSLRERRDEVKARLDESYSPCDIFWLAREHILLKNRDSGEGQIVGWECWDKAQSEGEIDLRRRSEGSGLLNSEALAEFLVFFGMITPKQATCTIS